MSREQGNRAFRDGDLEHAVELYSQAIQEDSADARAWGNRCEVWLRTCHFERAVEDGTEYLRLLPTDPKPHCRLARAYLGIDALNNDLHARGLAVRSLMTALNLDPTSVEVGQLLAEVWQDSNFQACFTEHEVSDISAQVCRAMTAPAHNVKQLNLFLDMNVNLLQPVPCDTHSPGTRQILAALETSKPLLGSDATAEWVSGSVLHIAVSVLAADSEEFKRILKNASVSGGIDEPCCAIRDRHGFVRTPTALMVAVACKRYEAVSHLIEHRANVNRAVPWANTRGAVSALALALEGCPLLSHEERADRLARKREYMRQAARHRALGKKVMGPPDDIQVAECLSPDDKKMVVSLIEAGGEHAKWSVPKGNGGVGRGLEGIQGVGVQKKKGLWVRL
eukprot:TRINITY_DN17093_c0_g1_i4.p1 TRINITY_DN17093_c0_g1~~TRINITY_DN17093_c0_g1_i4.p1  ORF type:complete len:394 (-),score=55.36 TRINITY_DN17093_c0_g1_i4:109-1290(-)